MIAKQLIWKQIQSKQFPPSNPNIIPTFDIFPSTTQYKDQSILLGLVLKPFGLGEHPNSENIPEVCFGTMGIIRCQICKCYMNPFNPIQTSRSSYYCCICGWLNPLPTKYDPGQMNVERANLTYDIVPFNNEFSSKKISEPHIVILVQTSYEFLRSTAYEMLISAVEYSVELMPPQQNVMLVTYDDRYVSAYDLRGQGTRYCLSLDEKPIKDSLCREIQDVKENLIKILKTLPQLYQTPNYDKQKLHNRRGMQYSIQCLFKIGGKILHFVNTNIPPASILNGPKNKQEGFYSSTIYYDRIAKICNEHSISYSIFLFCNIESSVIEIADLCLQTQGVFKLYRKQDSVEQFYYNLIEVLVEETVYSATSRLRCSCNTIEANGKTVLSNQWELTQNNKSNPGHLINYNYLSPDMFVVMTVNLRENITDKYLVLQNSCLYMSPDGKTKLRISNWAIPLSQTLSAVHNSSNYEGLSVYFLRNEIELLIKARGVVRTMEQRIVSLCKKIIFYKKHQWTQDLIFICLSLLKNKIGVKQKGMMFTKKRLEEMWLNMVGLLALNPSQLLTQFIPQLFQVPDKQQQQNQESEQSDHLPPLLPLINTAIQDSKVYVLLCGKTVIVYYSQNYSKYRLYSQESNNQIAALIDKLSALNSYKHYRVKQTGHNQFGDQQYQDFINYLLYSEGLYELRITHQQFLQLFG